MKPVSDSVELFNRNRLQAAAGAGDFYFPSATVGKNAAVIMNSCLGRWFAQDKRRKEWWEGATLEKRGEIVIIRLDKKRVEGDGGSMGVIREESACSGLSSEAERLLRIEAATH